MIFSKTTQYAFQIMNFLGTQKGQKVGVSQIQKYFQENTPYIMKVFQILVQKELLSSKKGPQGGFSMIKQDISLFDVLTAIEGEEALSQCGFRPERCNVRNACPLHIKYSKQRYEFCQYLRQEKVCK